MRKDNNGKTKRRVSPTAPIKYVEQRKLLKQYVEDGKIILFEERE